MRKKMTRHPQEFHVDRDHTCLYCLEWMFKKFGYVDEKDVMHFELPTERDK